MLEQTLRELATATIFSSENLAAELMSEVRKLLLTDPKSADKDQPQLDNRCRSLLKTELDQDFSRRFRLNDLEQIFGLLWPAGFASQRTLPLLDDLAKRLFVDSLASVNYHVDQISGYARFCSRIDPAVVAGWRMATSIVSGALSSVNQVEELATRHHPMYTPKLMADKVFAENHVHLHGVYAAELGLANALFTIDGIGVGSDRFLSTRRWITMLLCDATPVDEAISDAVLRNELTGNWQSDVSLPADWTGWSEYHVAPIPSNPLWIRKKLASAWIQQDVDLAWLWFYTWLWFCYQTTESRKLRIALFAATVTLMNVRRRLLMDGQGLSRFIPLYHHKVRKNATAEAKLHSSLRRILGGNCDVAEIKVSPFGVRRLIGEVSQALAQRETSPVADAVDNRVTEIHQAICDASDRWHFCVHFLRSQDYADKPSLFWKHVTRLKRDMDGLPDWSWVAATSQGASELFNEPVRRWVRGLDVAGDENRLKIELFAPGLRWLRHQDLHQGDQKQAPKKLHLSIHAGEDYADLLSGMRHVDETVLFCDMSDGDRLGHALAIGIEPKQWASRQNDVILDLDEHVDNLIWAWKKAQELARLLPEMHSMVDEFATRANALIEHLPWFASPFQKPVGYWNLNLHLNAWSLRRNSYHRMLQFGKEGGPGGTELATVAPDYERLTNSEDPVVDLYMRRAYWLSQRPSNTHMPSSMSISPQTHNMPKVHVRLGGHSVGVLPRKNGSVPDLIEDVCSDDQLRFMHALQDLLISKYAEKGIGIETNPTSNVYIARLRDYTEHPIFRWNPPDSNDLKSTALNPFSLRTGSIAVTVNTDDPGIMPTTLRMEFDLLADAAVRLGYPSKQVTQWITSLRLQGVSEFNAKH